MNESPELARNTLAGEVWLVLGMHRSGTSAATRALSLLGGALPSDLMPPSTDNPMGFWESRSLAQLNDELLSERELNWYALANAPEDESLLDKQRESARGWLEGHLTSAGPHVLKDPRICTLLPVWLPALTAAGFRVRALLVYRRAEEVAASLAARQGFDRSKSIALWLHSILQAELHTRELPRAWIAYETLLREPRHLLSLFDDIPKDERPAWNDEIDAFLDPSIRHHELADNVEGPLGHWQNALYAALGLFATDEHNARTQMDTLRQEVEIAQAHYGPEILELMRTVRREREIAQELRVEGRHVRKALENECAALKAASESLTTELAHAQSEGETLRVRLQEEESRVTAIEEELFQSRRMLRDLRAAFDEEKGRRFRERKENRAATMSLERRLEDERKKSAAHLRRAQQLSRALKEYGDWTGRKSRRLDPRAIIRAASAALQGRRPGRARAFYEIIATPYFNAEYYLAKYPDVARSGMHPAMHYLRHGGFEGRAPSPLFNGAEYLRQHPDVAKARINPLLHFIRHGAAEGRAAPPLVES